MRATIEELWRWPVKSMGGERVPALRVDAHGGAGDRAYVAYGERGQLTARQAPRLLAWRATADGVLAPDGRQHAYDDPALAAALAADLGRPLELRYAQHGEPDLADSLLITFGATHRALEQELGTPIDPRRWRTNLHLEADVPAWAELEWEGQVLELEGGVVLRLLHPCQRCAIPTRDPDTQAKWPELLKHLHRHHATQFGINARVEVPGELREGYSAWTSESTSATEALASPNSSAVFSA